MNSSPIGNRIKALRKILKLRQEDIAKKIGISGVAVGNWERGENEPTGVNLLKLAQALQTTPEFIISGTGNEKYDVREPRIEYGPSLRKVPLISSVQAGAWSEAIDIFYPGDADEWVETSVPLSKSAFALTVTGKSMQNPNGHPSIPHGSIVIIDPEIDATNGKIVVAKLPQTNEVTIKKYVIDGADTYLEPLNPEYRTIRIDEDCVIVGVVKQAIQNF